MSKYRLTIDHDPDTALPDNSTTKECTAWRNGWTYTYVLESLSTCDECGHVASDIMIDSCGGIIGIERLIEMVREAIEVVVDANDIEIGGRRGYVIRTSDLISNEDAKSKKDTMTVECKCRICKGKEHWNPPQPPNPLHVGSWRYQDVPLTNEQVEVGQWVNDVGWMVPDTRLQAIAAAPKCKHELIDRHTGPVLNANLTQKRHPNGEFVSMWCEGAPELRVLLGALTEEKQ